MYKNQFQTGFLTILYSIGLKPLQEWYMEVKNGHIKRLVDNDMQSSVIEIAGANVVNNFIRIPNDDKKILGIKMPHLVLQVKNLRKYFMFEVLVIDDKGIKRTFKTTNFQTLTRVKPSLCSIPLKLDDGWNQVFFNLVDFVKRAYSTNYQETLKVQINANCRIRRVYFTDHPQNSRKIPPEYKAFACIEEDGTDKVGRSVIEEENI
mmetsp:Transcript_9385/g.9720  ORF Transcript_9385/g.9720 Transcript_9385/m.9720 type:complete len:206 (-) Transcript_9385:42-659(-)